MTATDTTRDAFQPPPPGEFLGHPRPLWMLFGAEFWERFAYYGMRAFLVTYVAVAFFNHLPAGQDRAAASLTFGAYTALISIWLPEFWLHPFGPLLKNVPVFAMIGALLVLDRPGHGPGDR